MPARRVGNRLFSRTALPLFAVGAMLLAAGIYGAWRVHRLHKRGSEMLSENVASIRAAEHLAVITRDIRHRLKRHFSSGNDRHLKDIEELMPLGLTALKEAEGLATTAREQQIIRQTREDYEQFRADFARLASEPSSIVRRETMLNLADNVIPNKLLPHADRYIELNERALDRSNQRNQSTANQLMFGLLLLGTCGGVAGLIAGYGIARLVNRTIVQLAIPIRDTAGKLSQVAGPVTWTAKPGFDDLESVLKSVSDHVRTVVERLQESERDRLRAEQLAALGQLAAGLAHELRNPLTSMKAILQLAPEPDDLTIRDVEILREETGRLEQTVQSLLDFARPPQPHKTKTSLCGLLEQSVSLVERRCQRKGVSLHYVPTPSEIVMLADGAQLRQVFLNILLNAIDVTPRGGTILLECRPVPAPGTATRQSFRSRSRFAHPPEEDWVVVRVSDAGPGLPHEMGERIFEPFVTTKETGTGLGLSICNRIVQCHGGAISARNRIDGGAVFETHLPLESNAKPRSSPWPNAGKVAALTTAPLLDDLIATGDGNGEA